MRRYAILLTTLALIGAAPASLDPVTAASTGPTDVAEADRCDLIDPARCLLPFPNDHFTVDDPGTMTGKRVDIHSLSAPRVAGGVKPLSTDELNRNDGFSPGSMAMTFVPSLDLHRTWGTHELPEAQRDHLADIARYEAADAPMLLVNAETGERHPFWSELDTHPETGDDERMLILRPAVNLDEATRYLVVLRDLRDGDGEAIPAGPEFAAYLSGSGADTERQEAIDRILDEVAQAETARGNDFARDDVYLAWEFTVASWQNLAGRVLHMRNDAFARLGDFDLADVEIDGLAPAFEVDEVIAEDGDRLAFVHGRYEVPNYLTHDVNTHDVSDPTGGQITEERVSPLYAPQARLYYPPGEELPAVNPVQPTLEADFTCSIPATALNEDGSVDPVLPILMGHGLLGERKEVGWSSANQLTREANGMYCGTEWIGMALGDLPNVAAILVDPSLFASLADRAQQGFVNFLYLGRLMIHPDGLRTDPAFQTAEGESYIDPSRELVYDGNSQGGIMGGALAALAPDFTKAVLGVPAMNYSTLLNRSVDWEGHIDDIEPVPVGYSTGFYASVPDKRDQQIMFALMQMLWDRGEANGYAHHMSDDPYPNTPAHQIMLHVAFGDYQVANVAAEVEARTIGARLIQTALAPGRHWAVDPTVGLDVFDTDEAGNLLPWNGSALVYWDSGNPTPPSGNVPPEDLGEDPHDDPRSAPLSGPQRIRFFDTGEIIDPYGGAPYCTHRFPRHPDDFPAGCPSD